MKKLALAALFSLAATQASASIVETVHLEFQSGGVYDGTITFNDGYQGMVDTDGYLTGGSNNYNEYFSWTWWQGTNQTNPQNYFGQGYMDWLMNGSSNFSYTQYIGLTWDVNASVLQGGLSLVDTHNSYSFGNAAYNDAIVSWSIGGTSVPESSGLLLLTLGLAGLAAQRKLRA